MRALLLTLLAGLALWACSSAPGPCTNLVHDPCDLDAGSGCPAHQQCVDATQAIDPCPSDAGGCCFQVCTKDADCPSGQLCTEGACAQGRCVQ